MRGHVARMGVMGTAWVCNTTVGKSDRNRTLGSFRCRQDNIKMDLTQTVREDMDDSCC